jgi:transcriptional regulator GlxA family with amidase domain
VPRHLPEPVVSASRCRAGSLPAMRARYPTIADQEEARDGKQSVASASWSFDGVKLLDVAGPSEAFSEANRFGADYQVVLDSADGHELASSTRMRISVHAAAADPGPLAMALVAGGDVSPTHPVSPELPEAAQILAARTRRRWPR